MGNVRIKLSFRRLRRGGRQFYSSWLSNSKDRIKKKTNNKNRILSRNYIRIGTVVSMDKPGPVSGKIILIRADTLIDGSGEPPVRDAGKGDTDGHDEQCRNVTTKGSWQDSARYDCGYCTAG